MFINEDLLLAMGGTNINYNAGEIIFSEDALSTFYYQISKGQVKLNNYNDEGKEFIQDIFGEGESFAESLLFINKPYPMNAIALTQCEIIKISKEIFFSLLELHSNIGESFRKGLSEKLYCKYIMLRNNSSRNPVVRLTGLFDYLKNFQEEKTPYSFEVPLTRQQLASLTGLCVETTIRTIKNMEKNNVLKIKNRKIYY